MTFAVVCVLALAPALLAQQPATEPTPAGADEETAQQAAPEGEEGVASSEEPDEQSLDAIERMLQEEEMVLEGAGYTYDPANRRDPFLSLLTVIDQPELLGPRPEGIPGLLIDEIEITGVFVTPAGPVAQVQAADKAKSYLVHEGEKLYDGEVTDIRFEKDEVAEVVFRQDVRDPSAVKPFREVVKQLNP